MSVYQALYRKWRPMIFEDVVGQEHISETLRNGVMNGKIAHAYLFCGTRGTGKTTCAKILSRAVNCENPQNGNPCNKCPSCLGILDGSNMDVFEMDAASNRGVGDIRQIRDEVDYAPASSKYKVYIIDEAHMITNEGFNALLKTLEEPPEYVIFILATTEPHKILPTILSRCQRFDFRRIGLDAIALRLEKICAAENIDITPDACELIASLADGSMRDGLSILEQCAASVKEKITTGAVSETVGIASDRVLFEVADAVSVRDTVEALKVSADFLNKGKEGTVFLSDLTEHFRSLLFCKAAENPSELIEKSADRIEKYKVQAEKFSTETLIYFITTLCEYMTKAKWIQNPKISVEMALIALCAPSFSDEREALEARIAALEAKIASGNITISAVGKKPSAAASKKAAPARVNANNESGLKDCDSQGGKENYKEASVGEEWSQWSEALTTIKNESKKLYMFLIKAKAYRFSDTVELVLSNREAYERISTPEGKAYLRDLFEKLSGEALNVKISEEGRRMAIPENDNNTSASIMDLAKKKDILGDVMTIIDE